MGLDASVMCNCYREGRTSPCPFPDDLYIDEDGFPALRINRPDEESRSEVFDAWLSHCCEHPNMDYAAVFVAKWQGYNAFRRALEEIGWEQFPVLKAHLPEHNQGSVPASAAAQALRELEHFQAHEGIPKTFLINSDTDEVVASAISDYGAAFGVNPRTGMNLSFDENGFFIQDVWEYNRELFRAIRFEQVALDSATLDRPQQYEYINLDNGRRFVCSTPVRVFVRGDFGTLKQEYPHRMHIERRTVDADYFAYIIKPLTFIFQASVETGNPVRWS
ncbi:MAG: hypothetical protein JNJ61_19225 [Anaerolineae bacterium]|nr:hypothetical protein [Anaerolineae bacterium]